MTDHFMGEPCDCKMTLEIPWSMSKRIREIANAEAPQLHDKHVSVNQIILRALWTYLYGKALTENKEDA